jgi:hypothetical protein
MVERMTQDRRRKRAIRERMRRTGETYMIAARAIDKAHQERQTKQEEEPDAESRLGYPGGYGRWLGP